MGMGDPKMGMKERGDTGGSLGGHWDHWGGIGILGGHWGTLGNLWGALGSSGGHWNPLGNLWRILWEMLGDTGGHWDPLGDTGVRFFGGIQDPLAGILGCALRGDTGILWGTLGSFGGTLGSFGGTGILWDQPRSLGVTFGGSFGGHWDPLGDTGILWGTLGSSVGIWDPRGAPPQIPPFRTAPLGTAMLPGAPPSFLRRPPCFRTAPRYFRFCRKRPCLFLPAPA